MLHHILNPIGVEVTDLPLTDVDAAAVSRLEELLSEHGVAVLPGQQLDDTEFIGFLQQFGDLMLSIGETPVDGFPDLNVISNVGRETPPRSVFHVDTSYVSHPPTYTALRAVEIPSQGGETLFTNQYRAYETLPPEVRSDLEGRTIRHVMTGLDLDEDAETEADHPVFRRHPISGRTALYLSTPARCVSISGMDDAKGKDMIEFLYAHSTAPHNTYRHAWAPGDVVMWDNGCVLHRADHADVIGDRVMHRGMVATGTKHRDGTFPHVD
ncbi:taurine dioxygenase [Nakamurella sp. UYEF19]|uniref:TauD/TfdA dioxygenase family protein n=1 Tax=Nakamurella sp. UYEF19 TaxID=1756392 RepID=UPI003397C1B4